MMAACEKAASVVKYLHACSRRGIVFHRGSETMKRDKTQYAVRKIEQVELCG